MCSSGFVVSDASKYPVPTPAKCMLAKNVAADAVAWAVSCCAPSGLWNNTDIAATATSITASGQEPAHTTRVEVREVELPGRAQFAPEHRRDDEARDHEEGVDTDVSARQRQLGVERHDREHGNAAESLNVGAPRMPGFRRASLTLVRAIDGGQVSPRIPAPHRAPV